MKIMVNFMAKWQLYNKLGVIVRKQKPKYINNIDYVFYY